MDRTKYLGGSDVAAILGISPWRTPLEVYLDKVQPRIKTIDPNKQKVFTRGQRMEPYVIDLLAEETGFEIVSRGNRYIHRDYNFIAAEIDFEYFDPGTGQVENGGNKDSQPLQGKRMGRGSD
ncbi:YqaJ viral recombinase family protein [Serratia marcescens]|nr:YqaJ viral recombinase family protein [Serratia marcescens]